MVAQSRRKLEQDGWQRELRAAYARPAELLAALDLRPAEVGLSEVAARDFPLRVPRPFVQRMIRGNARDPLLLQVLPRGLETAPASGFGDDPVGDLAAVRTPGLLHKYAGRALLILSGGCAVNCRYCFRRAFPYAGAVGRGRLEDALAVLAADASISEVILSGGDPLIWNDEALAALVQRLAAMPHLRRLRVHSRLPIVIPERATDGLCAALTGSRLPAVLVLHANHPRELDDAVLSACARLRMSGLVLLNQSVLLAGINDDATVLGTLSERLFEAGVLPYYLHLLDRVRGAAHYEVPRARARAIAVALRDGLPGYLVPRLVEERAGAAAKLPVA